MNQYGARKLLDEYYEARRDQVECPDWIKPGEFCKAQCKAQIAESACIGAMTQNAETVAEQQREIARLKAWITTFAVHTDACVFAKSKSDRLICTCGLHEVLKK